MIKCFLCNDELNACERSGYRLKPEIVEQSSVVCAKCLYNPDEKLAKYNKVNVKMYDTIYSFLNKRSYLVSVVEEDCIFTHTEDGYSHPYTPRLGFDDFVIL